ncbi:ribosomal-processing cysteine protease Prp [Liquorilactobacillus satsumensis]|uniref:ribosomal-processing cysteine protease Prp n=1 Tax=Lactobacillaceae TaxID=33958 RepID=UPI001E2BFA10|nr:ribosomal-processing cysteine protease Prp [Liquorilactobacillus satsumensis]
MIKVQMIETRRFDERQVSIRASGHAGFDLPGKDIVCAAVSVLLEHTTQNLTSCRINDDGVSYKADVLNIDEGDKRLLRALGNTLATIANQYPDNLSFTTKV